MVRIQGGIRWPLGPGFIVKSGAFEHVYFAAARLDSAGMERVGVWATNRLDHTGLANCRTSRRGVSHARAHDSFGPDRLACRADDDGLA
jgi:hypothetical protein